MSPLGVGRDVGVWILAFVLVLSGAAKLRNPLPTALAIAGFGVLRRHREAAARALGATELALGLVLASQLLPWLALTAAAGLFAVFAVLLARTLVRGDRFPCGCFGTGDSPISAWTLIRAALLAAIALGALGVTVAGGAASATVTQARLLAAVAAAGLIAIAALAGDVPKLTRWNTDP